jgi:regulator of RNase E activity RraA
MGPGELRERFAALGTAQVADACVRARVQVRCAPAALRPVLPGTRLAGRACPVRHAGSVDIFLEALEQSRSGDVLVADNDARADEACLGDVIALEVQGAGLAGIVIWGLHRDTADLRAIGLPVFSLGAIPAGPLAPRPRHAGALESALVGDWLVTGEDLVLGDDDGVLFIPAGRADDLIALAEGIRDTERAQADRARAGVSVRAQLDFSGFLARREREPALSFRDHLRGIGGAVEE